MNCTDNGAAMSPRALNLSREELETARRLIDALAGEGPRVVVPFNELAATLADATGLPLPQASALLTASVPDHTVSFTQGVERERVRFRRSGADVVVTRRPATTEAELMARLVAQVLLDETAAWAMTVPNLTATLADLTGLTSLQVSKLLGASLPDGGRDVIARMREGVFSLRRRNGCVALIRMLLHNDGRLEALPIPHAVTEARDVAARYGVLPWREAA
jgi:hypothetical protein